MITMGGKKMRILVSGMTCGHCAARVVEALESLDGVKTAKVKLSRGEAIVSLSEDVSVETILEAVRRAGYEASAL